MGLHAVRCRLSFGGIGVAPRELITWRKWRVKFPADKIDAVLDQPRALLERELRSLEALAKRKRGRIAGCLPCTYKPRRIATPMPGKALVVAAAGNGTLPSPLRLIIPHLRKHATEQMADSA